MSASPREATLPQTAEELYARIKKGIESDAELLAATRATAERYHNGDLIAAWRSLRLRPLDQVAEAAHALSMLDPFTLPFMALVRVPPIENTLNTPALRFVYHIMLDCFYYQYAHIRKFLQLLAREFAAT